MTLCLVQPNSKTKYVRLWKYDPSWITDPARKKDPMKGWIQKPHSVPYEVEDTRFRDAVRLLALGWIMFNEGLSPLNGDRPIQLDPGLIDAVRNDPPIVPDDQTLIDFSAFWRTYKYRVDMETKEENLKQLKRNPLKVVLPSTKQKVLERYESGEALPYYALRLIRKDNRLDNEHGHSQNRIQQSSSRRFTQSARG